METLQALHVIYKLALMGLIWLLVLRMGMAELIDNLVDLLPYKYKRKVEFILWPTLFIFIIGAILAGVIKFAIDIF